VTSASTTAGAPEIGNVLIDSATVQFRDRSGRIVQALTPTNLRLAPGSFTALIGPSGCGKSTLLNAVAGFVPLHNGVIMVDGKHVSRPTPDVGVVFQQYALFPWFSAIGNVEFALKRFGIPKEQRRSQALAGLAEVGLGERSASFPGQLSGGMRQRVALARTLAARPKVLLMDEPFGALDAQTRVAMHELLLRIWETHRTTVLFVTHDVDEALILSDRIHVMSASPGRIVDTIEVTSARPRSVDAVDDTYIAHRNRIMRLLRRPDLAAAASPAESHATGAPQAGRR
jgi:NitT/TauT family transport system ATP-binding protein